MGVVKIEPGLVVSWRLRWIDGEEYGDAIDFSAFLPLSILGALDRIDTGGKDDADLIAEIVGQQMAETLRRLSGHDYQAELQARIDELEAQS